MKVKVNYDALESTASALDSTLGKIEAVLKEIDNIKKDVDTADDNHNNCFSSTVDVLEKLKIDYINHKTALEFIIQECKAAVEIFKSAENEVDYSNKNVRDFLISTYSILGLDEPSEGWDNTEFEEYSDDEFVNVTDTGADLAEGTWGTVFDIGSDDRLGYIELTEDTGAKVSDKAKSILGIGEDESKDPKKEEISGDESDDSDNTGDGTIEQPRIINTPVSTAATAATATAATTSKKDDEDKKKNDEDKKKNDEDENKKNEKEKEKKEEEKKEEEKKEEEKKEEEKKEEEKKEEEKKEGKTEEQTTTADPTPTTEPTPVQTPEPTPTATPWSPPSYTSTGGGNTSIEYPQEEFGIPEEPVSTEPISTEPIENPIEEPVVKEKSYTKIPVSSTPITTPTTKKSSGSSVFPIAAGISAAAAAGLGAKAYLDHKHNNENSEEDDEFDESEGDFDKDMDSVDSDLNYVEEYQADSDDLEYEDNQDAENTLSSDDEYVYRAVDNSSLEGRHEELLD